MISFAGALCLASIGVLALNHYKYIPLDDSAGLVCLSSASVYVLLGLLILVFKCLCSKRKKILVYRGVSLDESHDCPDSAGDVQSPER